MYYPHNLALYFSIMLNLRPSDIGESWDEHNEEMSEVSLWVCLGSFRGQFMNSKESITY